MTTMYCTPRERAIAARWSPTIGDRIDLRDEADIPPDTPEALRLRCDSLRIRGNPMIEKIQEQSKTMSFDDALAGIARTDTSTSSEALLQCMFALGPEILSLLIEELMTRVRTQEDAEGVALFSRIRHHAIAAFAVPLSSDA